MYPASDASVATAASVAACNLSSTFSSRRGTQWALPGTCCSGCWNQSKATLAVCLRACVRAACVCLVAKSDDSILGSELCALLFAAVEHVNSPCVALHKEQNKRPPIEHGRYMAARLLLLLILCNCQLNTFSPIVVVVIIISASALASLLLLFLLCVFMSN